MTRHLWSCLILGLTVFAASSASAQDNNILSQSPWDTSKMFITPSFSFNIGATSEPLDANFAAEELHISFWIGAEAHPQPGALSPYLALGLEVEPHALKEDDGSAVYFMPMARAGYAWTSCGDDGQTTYATTAFPCLNVYGMFGLRPGSFTRPASARVGLGLNSPWLTAGALMAELIIPSHYEFLVEFNPVDDEPLYLFRVGFGF